MNANVRAQLLAHGAKIPKDSPNLTQERRTPPPPTKDTKAPVVARVAPESGEDVTPPPAKSQTHYIGPYQLAVANGTHFPGRSRCVIVGPASDELITALTDALHQFTNQP